MANTFLFAQGIDIGGSLAERDMADTARDIMAEAEARGCQLLLPVDFVVATEVKPGAASRPVVAGAALSPDDKILDAGPATVARLLEALTASKTLIWNGPLGVFEVPPFDKGTMGAAHLASVYARAGKIVAVAGGGDTVAALNQAGVVDDFTFVSTAGGAFLEWMEGKILPGGWLFPGLDPMDPLSTRQLNRAIHAAAEAAGREQRLASAAASAATSAASAAAAAATSWDVSELAATPPLPLPDDWLTVHQLRAARAHLVRSLTMGQRQLRECIGRARELGAAAEEQLRGGGVGEGVSGGAWEGSAFKWSLISTLRAKYLVRAALLALSLHAGARRQRRGAVRSRVRRARPCRHGQRVPA
jgi:hypothetical protein